MSAWTAFTTCSCQTLRRDLYPTSAPNRLSRSAPEKRAYTSIIVWNGHARKRVVTVIADDSLCPSPSMSESAAPAPKTLYRWQRDALDAWAGHGHRGIVEAVTGAGKTALGIRAVAMRLETGGVAAVVVPTRELMYQWARGLRRELAMVELGLLGDGRRDTLRQHDVLVATVHSARKRFHPAQHDRFIS